MSVSRFKDRAGIILLTFTVKLIGVVMAYDRRMLGEYLRRIIRSSTCDMSARPQDVPFELILGAGAKIEMSGGWSCRSHFPEDGPPTVCIFGEGRQALDSFVDDVASDQLMRVEVGRKAIRSAVNEFVQGAFLKGVPLDLADAVRFQILKPLKDCVYNWTAFVPLDNIDARVDLELGSARVITHGQAIAEVREYVESTPNRDSDLTRECGAPTHAEWSKMIIASVARHPGAFLRIDIRAHKDVLEDRSEYYALQAVNVLRAFTHLFAPSDHRSFPYAFGEVARGRFSWGALRRSDTSSLSVCNIAVGPLLPFKLDDEVKQHLIEKCSFLVLQRSLATPPSERDSFDHAIIAAAECIGRSVIATMKHQALLESTTAIERLVVGQNEMVTTERFADRLVLLIEERRAERIATHRRATKLYDVRSRVVHTGVTDIVQQDVESMRELAFAALMGALASRGQFTSHEAFCNDLHARRFGD